MFEEDVNQETTNIIRYKDRKPDKIDCLNLYESINNYFMQSGIYILDKPNDNCRFNFINMIRTFMYK